MSIDFAHEANEDSEFCSDWATVARAFDGESPFRGQH